MLIMRTILLLLLIIVSFFSNGQTIYVNQAATGADNGTSWTDAYTSLETAISSINTPNKEVWIAAGTYSTTSGSLMFPINYAGTIIYGGFDGTETVMSERNWITNKTIVSGDILGNDNGVVSFTSTLRNDNSVRLFTINANDVVLDGLTLSDAHANGGGTNSSGGAILKAPTVTNLTIKNCEFKNNVSYDAAACIHAVFNVTGFLLIENSKFINNLSTYATSIYSYTNASSTILNVDVINSLFDGNKAIDNGATKGYAGSAGWVRAYAASSTVNAKFTNNTYVNNIDTGTNSYVLNRGTIGLTRSGVATVILNGDIYNCIFWNNSGVGGATSKAVNNIVEVLPATLTANNSLDSDNFSTISFKQNTVTTNPLFVSSSDYELTNTSPAKDTGNNSYISLTTDLNNKPRIVNTTVDMGVYEYGDLCGFQVASITENTANVSWNANITTDLLYVVSGEPVANGTSITGLSTNSAVLNGLTPNTYYDVYSSATCSATANSGWYLVNTFKTLGTIYVNHAATGTNDGNSWANAFTTLEEAFQNVTATHNEIRVAQGIYKPSTVGLSNSRKATFLVPANAKLYGGFNGTEVTLAERNPKTNITILDGDINGNDNSNIAHTNGSRSDNVYHVVSLKGNVTNIIIDGFTISGGNANGTQNYTLGINSYDDTRAGAIYANPNDVANPFLSATIRDCVLEKNTASDVGVYAQVSVLTISTTTVNFDRCIVRNNQSSGSFGNIFITGFKNSTSNIVANSNFTNCLFYNNVSNSSSNQSASCIMTYQNATAGGSYTTAYVNIVNCTFANNSGQAGHAISLAYSSNTNIVNSIIYNNGSNTPLYLLPTNSVLPTGINNIIQGGQLNGVNANPMFIGGTDFQLMASSPAIDSGSNAYVSGILTDLNGNARVINATVDKGAYEYDSTLSSISFNNFSNFTIYPNPSATLFSITSNEIIKSVEVYSLDGKLILETKENKVDVSNLQNGLYIIKVTTNQNGVGTKKFVKR